MSKLYIKYLDKSLILLELWQQARYLPHIYSMKEHPELTLEICQRDIEQMRANGSMKLTTYYGKKLSINLSDDVFDSAKYEEEQGYQRATQIIHKLQKQQVMRCVLHYFKAK